MRLAPRSLRSVDFQGDDAQKMFAQCRQIMAQIMIRSNPLDCVRLYKTRFNPISSLCSVSFTAADGDEPTSAGGSFFFFF